jgi:nitroreductase
VNVSTFLKSHKSIRKYKSDDIADDLLNDLILCGQRASSSGNMQSWSVVITKDIERKKKLHKLHLEQDMILQAPVVLTFCSDFNRIRQWLDLNNSAQSFDDYLGFQTGLIDAVIAAQNTAVAAESHGLGICYMGTTQWAADKISEFLELPDYVVPVTSLVIGYPDEEVEEVRYRLPQEALVFKEKYPKRSDEEIKALYEEFERSSWERYKTFPGLIETLEKEGITKVSDFYTSKIKYSKELHDRTSKMFLYLLKEKKFLK